MTKIGRFETISKCFGPAASVEIFNTYQYQRIVSEYAISGPYVSPSNFYEVLKLAKMIKIDVWTKWDFLKKCQKIMGTLLELQFSHTSKPILSFRVCNFRVIGKKFMGFGSWQK